MLSCRIRFTGRSFLLADTRWSEAACSTCASSFLPTSVGEGRINRMLPRFPVSQGFTLLQLFCSPDW
jgi:hypothetical protein